MKTPRMHCTFIVSLSLALLGGAGLGCSSKPKKAPRTQAVDQLILKNVHSRRPISSSAHPMAGPGGEDYISHPLPDENFDCQALEELFRDLPLLDIRSCLNSIQTQIKLTYLLRRETMPNLLLEDSDVSGDENSQNLSCIQTTLERIPVPREILFQSYELGKHPETLRCYSSRIAIQKDEVLGAKLPINRWRMQVVLPLKKPLADDQETAFLLKTWILTPFWGDHRKIPVTLVPDSICKRCMGEARWIDQFSPPPLLWPE